jgi:hypothetical protein
MRTATVYAVTWENLSRYQSLLYDLPDVPSGLRVFNGRAKESWWEPPPVYVEQPRLEAPDFWHLFGVGTFVMKPRLAETLGAFLHPVGELLPLRLSGANETLLALNILRDIDCLNPSAVDIDSLEVYSDFVPHRLPVSGLFKVPPVDRVHIFYLERSDDPASLRTVIETNRYRGLRFDPIWSSDGSIAPVNLMTL